MPTAAATASAVACRSPGHEHRLDAEPVQRVDRVADVGFTASRHDERGAHLTVPRPRTRSCVLRAAAAASTASSSGSGRADPVPAPDPDLGPVDDGLHALPGHVGELGRGDQPTHALTHARGDRASDRVLGPVLGGTREQQRARARLRRERRPRRPASSSRW